MEDEENILKSDLSSDVLGGFESLEYTLDMMEYENIYKKILSILPSNAISFEKFGLEKMIACEIICAAICHKINWDYLRQSIYERTLTNPKWLEINCLLNISANEIEELLQHYERKERIQAQERSRMIRTIVKQLKDNGISFSDIFMQNGILKQYAQIESFFLQCKVFSRDPQQKKYQLLIQTLSDYKGFEGLSDYYKPTIDYHLIRLFLRRGIVRPHNKYAYQFIFDQNVIRKENTIATLRSVCSKSLEDLCWITSQNLKYVNRIEWWVGRSVCTSGNPDCYLQRKDAKWLRKKFERCPYYDTCYARKYNTALLNINEPKYNGSSF